MLTLYYSPGASSVIPHITLEEIRVPYQRKLINLAKGEHKTDAYFEDQSSWKGAGTFR
jgi:glutathione S-transferase